MPGPGGARRPGRPHAQRHAKLLARAAAAHRSGRLVDAERIYRQLAEELPDNAEIHSVLGLLLAQRGDVDGALRAYRRALDLDDSVPHRHTEYLQVLLEAKRYADAVKAAQRARGAVQPTVDLLVQSASAYLGSGRIDAAIGSAREALARDPEAVGALLVLGSALVEQERYPEAVEALERAAGLGTTIAMVHYRLGMTYYALSELESAARSLRTALRLAKNPTERMGANTGLGMVAQEQRRPDEAIRYYDAALHLDPGNDRVLFNQAHALLSIGELERGWAQYAHGFAAGARTPVRTFSVPRWTPASTAERVMVWKEQGVGDDIRLASCFPDIIAAVDSVVIETDRRLVSLYARSFPTAQVREQRIDLEDYDAQLPTFDLAGIYRPTVESFDDAPLSWLTAEPDLVARMGARLAGQSSALRVGICWRSMKLDTTRLMHYTTLAEWGPVLSVPGVEWYSLQYGDPALVDSELEEVAHTRGVRIRRLEGVDYTDDFETVAALMTNLDVVVSVGTSVALLAAALGRPLLYLIPEKAPLQLGRHDEPWMPSATVLARRVDEGWQEPMREAARLVEGRVAARQSDRGA